MRLRIQDYLRYPPGLREPGRPNVDVKSFQNGAIKFNPCQITVQNLEWSLKGASLELVLLDRDSQAPIIAKFERRWDLGPEAPDELLLRNLEGFLIETIAHEMRELLLYKGSRRDPHAEYP